MPRLAPALLAAFFTTACVPSLGTMNAPTLSASQSPGSTPTTSPSASPALPAAGAFGTLEVTINGTPLEMKGDVGRILGNNSSLLTYTRYSYSGPRDPESSEPFSSVSLYFEKTKGLKPFVLPSVENDQERRAVVDRNGIQFHSSITTAKDKNDTFKYENGRVTGTWTFDAPAGGPRQALSEIAITVDLEVPPEIR